MIYQSQMSSQIFMIPQTHRIGGHQNTSHRRRHMEETIQAFGVTFSKPFLLKMQYSKPSKIIEI